MTDGTNNILMIEDDPGDAEYIRDLLIEQKTGRSRIDLKWVERLAEGTQAIENQSFQLVLLDLNLPDSRGLDSLETIQETNPEIPVVVLTGLDDREFGMNAVERGAQDFLVKDEISRGILHRSISYALERHRLLKREKQARKELQTALDKLERLNQTLEEQVRERTRDIKEFLYAASHDLREPSRVISLHVDEIENMFAEMNTEIPDEGKKSFRYLREAALQQQRLIRGMLRILKVGTMEVQMTTLSLEECVEDAINKMGEETSEASITVNRESLPEVRGNGPLLINLFENLIRNAIEYAGETPPEITIRANETDDGIVCDVEDQGLGMDPETVERLFQPFQSLTQEGLKEGTGLGLTLCRKIVERHDGEIWVETAPGEGTDVKFTLDRQ